MKDEYFDQLMRQALTPEISEPELKLRECYREERMIMKRKYNAKRILIAAVAVCMLIGGSCFAASRIASIRSGAVPNEFTEYSQMSEAENKVGYGIHSLERFTNGFAFDSMSVKKIEGLDESGDKVASEKGFTIVYRDDSGRIVDLNASKKLSQDRDSDSNVPAESKLISGITAYGYCADYKFVPNGYELTEEDRENLKRPDFEISYGTDSVEETKILSVVWEQEGIEYCLQHEGNRVDLEELFSMAQELIEKQ